MVRLLGFWAFARVVTLVGAFQTSYPSSKRIQCYWKTCQSRSGDLAGNAATDSGEYIFPSDQGYSRSLRQKTSLLRRLFGLSKIDPGRAYHERMRQKEARSFWTMMMGGKGRVSWRKTKKPGSLILVRHGESFGAQNETFLGWLDPDLTQRGVRESQHAARLLRESGYEIQVVFTSKLKRAIRSTWVMLRELDEAYLPVFGSWRLNERSYGVLTGFTDAEVSASMGPFATYRWRSDPREIPPPMLKSDSRWPGKERKYADLVQENKIPLSESLCDCMERVEPLWENQIKTELEVGHNVLVVGHGSSLRGIIKQIQGLDDKAAQNVKIPPGSPIVYEFDKNMQVLRSSDRVAGQQGLFGTFLDKPGLLEKALEREDEWKQHILKEEAHETSVDQPERVVVTSFETSLYKLQADRELEEWVGEAVHDVQMSGDGTQGTFSSALSAFTEKVFKGPHDTAKPNVRPFVISGHPCLEPLPEGVSLPKDIQLPERKDPVIVMVRHGNTEHNKLGLFTGWEDPCLTKEGALEAQQAGKLLKQNGFQFDVIYTSWLFRAIETAWLMMDELDSMWLPVVKSWRLNERHYGSLTGKSKKMVARVYGAEQLRKWRRGYKIKPPPVNSFSVDYPGNDIRYRTFLRDLPYSLSESIVRTIGRKKLTVSRKYPKTESLHCCMKRTIPYFAKNIVPEALDKGKRVLISSSENAIRGLLMHLCDIPEKHIPDISIPNGVPLVYDVNSRTVRLLDDKSGVHPMDKYDFGPAAQYMFGAGDGEKMEDEQCDMSDLSDEMLDALDAAFPSTETSSTPTSV